MGAEGGAPADGAGEAGALMVGGAGSGGGVGLVGDDKLADDGAGLSAGGFPAAGEGLGGVPGAGVETGESEGLTTGGLLGVSGLV